MLTDREILGLASQSLSLVLTGSLPSIAAAAIAGVAVALFQALTQIQEQTLSFGVKLVAVGITLYLTARWVGGEIFNYTVMLFDKFPMVVH